jgi:hypothetical protein
MQTEYHLAFLHLKCVVQVDRIIDLVFCIVLVANTYGHFGG